MYSVHTYAYMYIHLYIYICKLIQIAELCLFQLRPPAAIGVPLVHPHHIRTEWRHKPGFSGV